MFHTPTDPNCKESNHDRVSSQGTDSLLPGSDHSSYYLLRSNLPGLSLEIENPDTELPVLTFDFKAD
jgi:hypothetical protein